MEIIQDLARFRIPRGLPGRGRAYIQCWRIVQATLFRWSPTVLNGWRCFLLRTFGASIGRNVLMRPTVKTTYPWKLTIGNHTWVGDRVTLHSIGEIRIGDNVCIYDLCYLRRNSRLLQGLRSILLLR